MRRVLPLLSENQLIQVVNNAIESDGTAWNIAFDFFLESDDPGFTAFAERALAVSKGAEIADKIALAFASEGNPDRRAALAVILGKQAQGTLAIHEIDRALQLLSGDLVDRVMRHLCLGSFQGGDHTRVAMRLRDLAVRSPDGEVRARSVQLFRENHSLSGVRFLADRIQHDDNSAFRSVALDCLPALTSDPEVRKEMVAILTAVLTGQNWSQEHRRLAAGKLRTVMLNSETFLLSDDLRAVVDELAPAAPRSTD